MYRCQHRRPMSAEPHRRCSLRNDFPSVRFFTLFLSWLVVYSLPRGSGRYAADLTYSAWRHPEGNKKRKATTKCCAGLCGISASDTQTSVRKFHYFLVGFVAGLRNDDGTCEIPTGACFAFCEAHFSALTDTQSNFTACGGLSTRCPSVCVWN